MSYEELKPRRGAHTRSAGVSVSWRTNRPGHGNLLIITLGSEVCDRIGLHQGWRLRAEREVTLNRMRLLVDEHQGWKPAWKGSKHTTTRCASLHLPLLDVLLDESKPAQGVKFEYIKGGVEVRLPSWLAPPGFIKVPMRVA